MQTPGRDLLTAVTGTECGRSSAAGLRPRSLLLRFVLALAAPVRQCVQALLETKQEVEGLERGELLDIRSLQFSND